MYPSLQHCTLANTHFSPLCSAIINMRNCIISLMCLRSERRRQSGDIRDYYSVDETPTVICARALPQRSTPSSTHPSCFIPRDLCARVVFESVSVCFFCMFMHFLSTRPVSPHLSTGSLPFAPVKARTETVHSSGFLFAVRCAAYGRAPRACRDCNCDDVPLAGMVIKHTHTRGRSPWG